MGSIHLLYQEVERLRKCAVARKEFEDKAEQRLRDQEYEEHCKRERKMDRDYRIAIRWCIGVGASAVIVTMGAILTAIFGG